LGTDVQVPGASKWKKLFQFRPELAISSPTNLSKAKRWSPPDAFEPTSLTWPRGRIEDLVYVVGVLLYGDGCTAYWLGVRKEKDGRYSFHGGYSIILTAKSYRFVETFRNRLSSTLARKPTRVLGPNRDGHFTAKYSCIDFIRWWSSQSLESLGPLIGYSPLEYLRGRFDSDGYLNVTGVGLCGAEGHKLVMKHDRELCLAQGLRAGTITRVGPRPGEPYKIRGREVTITQQGLRFYVNPHDYERIIGGFNDEFKDRGLRRMIANYKGRKTTSWFREIREEAVGIHAEKKWGPRRISKEILRIRGIRVPESTIYKWVYKHGKSKQEFDSIRYRNAFPV
jgi:hypothetical protein